MPECSTGKRTVNFEPCKRDSNWRGYTTSLLVGQLLGLLAPLGCTRGSADHDFTAHFDACVKLEGMPGRYEHAVITKCLVDRYGWGIEEADVRARATIAVFYHRLDSMEQAIKDSVRQAEFAWQQHQDSVAAAERTRRAAAVAAAARATRLKYGTTSWVGDRASRIYFMNQQYYCLALRQVPEEQRVYFDTRQEAERAGYRLSREAGCRSAPTATDPDAE